MNVSVMGGFAFADTAKNGLAIVVTVLGQVVNLLTEQNVDDPRLTAMFAELLDEVTSDLAGLSAMTGEA